MHRWVSNEDRIVKEMWEENKLVKNRQATLCDEEKRVLGFFGNGKMID